MTVEVRASRADLVAGDAVLVSLPADPRFLRIARLTAAALAADLGFSVDDIEDLRIAVDESCAVVMAGADPGAVLELRYVPASDAMAVVVEGSCVVSPGGHVDPDIVVHPVAAELLDLTTDSHEFWSSARGRSFRFDKVVTGDGVGA